MLKEQAAPGPNADLWANLAQSIMDGNERNLGLDVETLNREMTDEETADSAIQQLTAAGLDSATAESTVKKYFKYLYNVSVPAFSESDPYRQFYQAMYLPQGGDERAAAAKIRKLAGKDTRAITSGLMKAGLKDEDDAEAFAYDIVRGQY